MAHELEQLMDRWGNATENAGRAHSASFSSPMRQVQSVDDAVDVVLTNGSKLPFFFSLCLQPARLKM